MTNLSNNKTRKTTWLSLSKGVDQGKGIEEDKKIRYMKEQKDEYIMTRRNKTIHQILSNKYCNGTY